MVKKNENKLIAGAAISNITPLKPHFLFGYPYVERISEGVHDWLLSSALYLSDGSTGLMLIANDVIFVTKASVARIREIITKRTGIPSDCILIGATHTHSGPVTVDYINSAHDPVVPKADPDYIRYMEDKISEAAINAYGIAAPAEAGFFVADGTGIGTNRHDPAGPSDLDIPVMIVKGTDNRLIACMIVCNMHPTVLHEDSKLYSGDFPAFTREILQKKYFGSETPVLYFTGAEGNQSPRHVTKSNTFEEAKRIGGIIADSVGTILNQGIVFSAAIPLSSLQKFIELPKRRFPDPESARKHRDKSLEKFNYLKKNSPDRKAIRTAEVDWFGAEELLFLSKLAQSGELDNIYKTCLPAEIQIFKIGKWNFVAWPGEIYIEYEIELKKKLQNTFLIGLSNGELQGYIATKEADDQGYYEAANSIFHYSAGDILVEETVKMIKKDE